MKPRNLFNIMIVTIIFSFMFSYTSNAEEPFLNSNISADKIPERIDENTIKYPISYKDKEFDIIINAQDGGLDREELDTTIHVEKIMYKYNKSEGGNASNGDDRVGAFGSLEVDLEYLYSDWDTLVKRYAERYETQPEYISIGDRKAVSFKQTIYDDEYNSEYSDIPSYSRNTSYDKAWLINLSELNIYNTEGFEDGVCVVVYARYDSLVIAKGNNIPVYTSLYESYMAEYEEAVKSIVSSIKIQIDTPEFSNSQEEDSTEADENSESESELVILDIPGPDNTVQTVVGTVVPGIGIIIIAVLGISTPPPPTPVKGPTGIRDGRSLTLKGKTDGREYNIKYNAEKDEWTNMETGNIFIPERFEGWQEDLAKDWEQSAKERERMSNRDTEFDREVKDSIEKDKENAELLKKLHHLRRSLNLHRTEAGRINRPSGEPGSMTDKINDLEKQLINGEAVDKELLRKVQRVYTKASNGDIVGYNDLPKNSIGKEFNDGIILTGKEIFSGSSTKALVLRGLLGVASFGYSETVMEIASAGFVIKDYVDKGGNSVAKGILLGIGNTVINQGTGLVTSRYTNYISKNASKAFHRLGGTSKEGYKIFKGVNNARNAKIKIRGKDISVGLNDKMIDNIIYNTADTVNNIYVAPPFQDIYKSYFN